MNEKTDERRDDKPDQTAIGPSAFVKWTENGVTQRGTVTGTFTRQGRKYLNVMSILGKRHILRRSRVKPVSVG